MPTQFSKAHKKLCGGTLFRWADEGLIQKET